MSVDLTNDIIFKAVFGKEQSKPILIDLLNAVLQDADFAKITEIALKNPVIIGDTSWMKTPELDILATDADGRRYNIEMQISPKPNFANRSLYYWSKLYASQMERGGYYEDLKPVICINFIDFTLNKNAPQFHRCFMALDKKNTEVALSEDLQIHFIELPTKEDKDSVLAIWAQLLKSATENSTEESMEYLFKRNPATKQAFNIYQDTLKDKDAYLSALSREKWYTDNVIRYEYEKEQSRLQGILDTARNLKNLGDPISKIAEATGLSEDVIRGL